MEFQQSVFYQGHYVSYQITTGDKISYHFSVKSKPDPEAYAPDNFKVIHAKGKWLFDKPINDDFQKSVIGVLKKLSR
ncbi:MAG TPA: hypothetical protein VGO09_01875 [Flavisolibacter sp.]|nr:hypothetical protein [Flavisolibacter sp.]